MGEWAGEARGLCASPDRIGHVLGEKEKLYKTELIRAKFPNETKSLAKKKKKKS